MPRQTMNELAGKYLARRRKKVAPSTFRNDESAVYRFARHWDATRKAPSSLTADAMESYIYDEGGLRDRYQHIPSYNKQVERLRGFIKWMVRRGVMRAEVLDELTSETKVPREYLRISLQQVHSMIETCDDEWERWVLALASQTLGRDSELRTLRVRDFNLDTARVAWLRHKTKDRDSIAITGDLDGAYRRWTTWLSSRLEEPLDANWYVVPRRVIGRKPNGEHDWWYRPELQRVQGLSPIVQKHVCRITGMSQESLKGQGVHIMRRSMARALYDRLVELGHADALRIVQAMLGHAKQGMTEQYIGLRADREKRDKLLEGSNLLGVTTDNVVKIGEARTHGSSAAV